MLLSVKQRKHLNHLLLNPVNYQVVSPDNISVDFFPGEQVTALGVFEGMRKNGFYLFVKLYSETFGISRGLMFFKVNALCF
jgi:hypothetical protein